MKLFKNSVGRPPNEILKKRKIFYAIVFILILGVSICCSFFIKEKLLGSTSNTITTYITGVNAQMVVNGKAIAKGKTVEKSVVGNNVIFMRSSEDGKVQLKVKYPSSIYNIKYDSNKEKKVKSSLYKYNHFVEFVSYNKKNQIVNTSGIVTVTKAEHTYTMQIRSNVHHIEVHYYIGTTNNKPGKKYSKNTFYFSTCASISSKSITSGLTSSSSGQYKTTKYNNYQFNFTITNKSETNLYYRWFTYSGNNVSTLSYAGNCVAFNSRSYNVNSMGLKVSKETNYRKGKLNIYSSKTLCQNDKKGTNGTNIGTKEIYIKYQGVKNLGNNFVGLNFNISNIGKKIGSQNQKGCLTYAKKYGNYILSTNGIKATYQSNPSYKSSYNELYNEIVKQINNGLPCIIRVNGIGQHFITIVGYKDKGSKTLNESTILNYLWSIDPWSPNGYSKYGSSVVKTGQANKIGSCPKKLLDKGLRYWKKN